VVVTGLRGMVERRLAGVVGQGDRMDVYARGGTVLRKMLLEAGAVERVGLEGVYSAGRADTGRGGEIRRGN